MTEKLYYKDQYLKEFRANVVALDGDKVALDRTAFYPEGGGQPWDTGVLTVPVGEENGTDDNTVAMQLKVLEVHERNGVIWHRVDRGSERAAWKENEAIASKLKIQEDDAEAMLKLKIGDTVMGYIDWSRRFDHMQQHSGEHIVSGIICRKFNCNNVGFHMGADVVTIDYDAEISYEQALEIESEANKYIWGNHEFQVTWPDAEELERIDFRSKKELNGAVRITTWPGADCCACCGTHVAFSGEVGLVKLASAHKFHEGTRLELYCGKRAFDFLSNSREANKKVSDLLSTKEELTPKIVKKQLEDYIALKSEMTEIENKYFKLLAEKYEGQTDAVIVSESLNPDQGRRLADALAGVIPGYAVVFTRAGQGSTSMRYAVISRDKDVAELVKKINQELCGKGGGRGGFAQGTVEAREELVTSFSI